LSKLTPSRRKLLLGGLAAGVGAGTGLFGGLGPLQRLAWADGHSPRYYIFCYFHGGWDTLLSLDPRHPGEWSPSELSAGLIETGYGSLQDPRLNNGFDAQPFLTDAGVALGPYMGDLGRAPEMAGKVCIVRGMSMETLTHEAGRRRFLTGRPPSGLLARGSSASTWLASHLEDGEAGEDGVPIPNLSVSVESFNGDHLPAHAAALGVTSVDDLMRTLREGPSSVASWEEAALNELLQHEAACPGALGSPLWQQAEEGRLNSVSMVEAQLHRHFDFAADTPEMRAIREFYGAYEPTDWRYSQREGLPPLAAATAVEAIKNGVSRVVSVELASGLDSHGQSWATEHGPKQEAGFNLVARMMEDLGRTEHAAGGTYLDYTTLIGFSEFSRTARLNVYGGRDHSLTGACFLAGGNIVGGRVLGASSSVGMEPTVMNLTTGESLEPSEHAEGVAEVVKPEHVLQALFQDAGMTEDEADLRVAPLAALFG
jgi:uncharacterized protein (DUF1501 family)